MANTNVRSDQFAATTGTWVEVPNTFSIGITLFPATEDLLVSVGRNTPAANTAFLVPAGGSLTMQPAPTGRIFLQSVTADQTVYTLGS